MSTSFQAKNSTQLSQQLKVQELNVVLTAAQANSASTIDLALVTLSGAAATRAVSVKVAETVSQIVSVSITNQSTGAIVALAAAPSISSSTNIATQIDASAVAAPLVVCVKYIVAE